MRKYCGCAKISLEISADLHIPPQLQIIGFCYAICLYVWMCASLAPEWFVELYTYLVFRSSSIVDWCPVNLNIPALQMGPKTQNGHFL
jgi:hypothetical protein